MGRRVTPQEAWAQVRSKIANRDGYIAARASVCTKGDRAFAVATLKKLAKLSELKARGTILERLYEVIKKHANGGNSLTKHNWEAGHWVVWGTGVRSLAISFSNLLSF